MSTNQPGIINDLIIYKGQPFNHQFTSSDNDVATDWTGFTGEFRIGLNRTDPPLLVKVITHGGVAGTITLDLTEADIDTLGIVETTFQYDVVMTSAGGVPERVLTGGMFYNLEVPDSS